MARIRSIKPEFWTDEKIVELSYPARLLFIGLWNFADDEGRMVYSPKRIKMQILPADPADIPELIGEILRESLAVIYVVDDIEYLQISNFTKHQKIDKRSISKLPPPPNSAEFPRIPPIPPAGSRRGEDQGGDHGKDQGAGSGAPLDGTEPVTAGTVCKRLKELGVSGVNPGHATLLMLIEAGATMDEFEGAAKDAVDRQKGGMSYVLGIVKGRREEARAASENIARGNISKKAPWYIAGASAIEEQAVRLGLTKEPDELPFQFYDRVKDKAGITPEMIRQAKIDFPENPRA